MTRARKLAASTTASSRRREAEPAHGMPWWFAGAAYVSEDDVIELRARVYIAGVALHCGPVGTPVASGERVVNVRFTMTPAEARALHKVLGRCVDASSAVVLEVSS